MADTTNATVATIVSLVANVAHHGQISIDGQPFLIFRIASNKKVLIFGININANGVHGLMMIDRYLTRHSLCWAHRVRQSLLS
jgi:hypothetical protein